MSKVTARDWATPDWPNDHKEYRRVVITSSSFNVYRDTRGPIWPLVGTQVAAVLKEVGEDVLKELGEGGQIVVTYYSEDELCPI